MKKTILKSLKYGFPFILSAIFAIGFSTLAMVYSSEMLNLALATDFEGMKANLLPLALFTLLNIPAQGLVAYTSATWTKKFNLAVKNTYIKKLFSKNINEFQDERNALYLSNLTNDMNTIETRFLVPVREIAYGFLLLITGILVIVSIDLTLMLTIGGVVILIVVGSLLMGKPLEKPESQKSLLLKEYTDYIKEVLSAFSIIKNNNLEQRISASFNRHSTLVQHKGYEIDKKETYISFLNSFLMNAAAFFGLFWLAQYSKQTGIQVGSVILIINNMNRILWPLMNMTEFLPRIRSTFKVIETMDDTLRNKLEYEETIELTDIQEGITFKDVHFEYDPQTPIFDGVNVSFEMGKKYLILGPSGKGKSTLLRLLRKYFNPDQGIIEMDGHILKDIKKMDYFQHISNIEQKVFLFEDSVRNNITLFKDYSDQQLHQAIKDAGLEDFVDGLEHGVDHIIVDDGKNVSGGQKARIAIARGLIRQSKILYLDEAFASLDDQMARQIEQTLLSLEGVLVLNVSHVLFKDTQHQYDHIYYVNHQQVVDITDRQ